MGLETATFISQLDNSWPLGGDPINRGDDHIRLLKTVLQSNFPNLAAAAVNVTDVELNLLVGLLASAAELNILDGATLTTAEINRLVGCTVNLSFLNGTSLASADDIIDNFPAGTLMLFQQTAAPTGWTKETTHNNKLLRLQTGTATTGGSDSFTTTFGSGKSTDAHTLTVAQTPAHTHGNSGGHTHNYLRAFQGNSSSSSPNLTGNTSTATTGTGNHTHTSVGSGSSHSHTLNNFDTQFVDVIIASKD